MSSPKKGNADLYQQFSKAYFFVYSTQTWAVFSQASGIAAASRFSGIENGTVGVDSGTGKTGNTKNQNGLQVVLKSISRGGANNRLAKRSVA